MSKKDKLWRTAVTVASIIEQDNKFLLIEEQTRDGLLINQPSGHLEANESPLEASIRETREETSFEFIPQNFLGVYLCQALSKKDSSHVTYVRLAFSGIVGKFYNQPLDKGIENIFWLNYEQILENQHKLRTPLVLRCINDYLKNKNLPLDSIYSHESIWQI